MATLFEDTAIREIAFDQSAGALGHLGMKAPQPSILAVPLPFRHRFRHL